MGLWYFSLWALGLTGAEVSGFTVFSVALLGYKPLRDAVYRHSKFFWLVAIVFGLMLAGNVGVGEYHFTAPPELRLVFLAIGTGAACLLLPVIWKNGQTDSHASAKFIIGLILMIIVKIGFTTHNPVCLMIYIGMAVDE